MIKNIFFDFNGTLLNDTKLCYEIESEMLKQENLPSISLEFYLDNFCFPVKKYYELAGFDVSDENFQKLSNIFFSLYTNRQEKETSLNEGVKRNLEKFKRDGYKLYILSASEEKILKIQLKQLGILEYFDDVVACKNVLALGKIEYGKLFIKENNIDPSMTLMIGDTYHDYEVAEALGLKPVLYTNGHNSRKVLERTNAPSVDSFDEFYDLVKKIDK